MSGPSAVRVRMYQVGFGDCFLVSFDYPGQNPSERHMLVDFGRNTRPHKGGDMAAVARDIRQRTNRRLDIVVVSHRHEDHLSAFGSTAVNSIIEDCNPRLIVRSWTEEPGASEVAPGPAMASPNARFLAGLAAADRVADRIAETPFALDRTGVGQSLKRFAFGQLKNRAAVTELNRLADATDGAYLSFGSPRLVDVLPGVDIDVLGPPTVADYPAIAGEADKDPEYWLALGRQLPDALAMAADGDDGPPAGPTRDSLQEEAPRIQLDAAETPVLATAPDAGEPRTSQPQDEGHASDAPAPGQIGPVRWLTEKLRKQQVASLLRIVRSLDDWLNNTSLILLVRAGDRRLLFAGDAQIENWRFPLKALPDEGERTRIGRELAQVDLYKVGHHGSRNATPKSLVKLWTASAPDRAVVSLLSTKEGVYGESITTAVPHARLMAKLDGGPRRLISTLQDPAAPDGRMFYEVWAPTAGSATFAEE